MKEFRILVLLTFKENLKNFSEKLIEANGLRDRLVSI